MAIGVIGRKAGMTRVFTPEGASIPVTVIEVEPNRVSQLRTQETDGYRAVQVTVGQRKPSSVSKPLAGHFVKAGVEAGRKTAEFRLSEGEGGDLTVGSELGVGLFAPGQKVDVQGRTKGRGFSGVIRRHHFRSQRETHGNSLSHRAPGSIGQNQTPGRVVKGKRMAGHLGDALRTQQGLEVVRVDAERNLLLVRGAVPGAAGGDLVVVPSVKVKSKG
jgi:large subunit ribosomal protein L3